MNKRLSIKSSHESVTISIDLPFRFLTVIINSFYISLAIFIIGFYSVIYFQQILQQSVFIPDQPLRFYNSPIIKTLIPHKPEIKKSGWSQETVSKYKIVYKGPRDIKRVALTFDADMTFEMQHSLKSGLVKSYYDENVIQVLNKTKTKATLFLSGLWIESYPHATKTLASNPLFELANHSYSHPGFNGECFGLPKVQERNKPDEIQQTQKLLKEYTGVTNKLFRFPGGCHSDSDLTKLHNLGITAVQWDSAGQDGFNNNAVAIEQNVLSSVQNGSIIVLHMSGFPNAPKTAEALPRIIAKLKVQGFEFVTVSELFKMNKTPKLSHQFLFSL